MINITKVIKEEDKQCIHCKTKENVDFYEIEIFGGNGLGGTRLNLCKDCMLKLQDEIRKNVKIFG